MKGQFHAYLNENQYIDNSVQGGNDNYLSIITQQIKNFQSPLQFHAKC